ncbi:MAG: ABC transporter permease [Acidobacteria bacterium]|nr:ABC transporter permease [Acidobacteriota bacterium]
MSAGYRAFSLTTRVSLWIILLFAAAALFSPWLAPYPYERQNLPHRLEGWNRQHWMGYDELGRDILSRLLYGARVSLMVGVVVVVGSALLGTLVGAVSGYYRGWMDDVLMRVVDTLMAVPGILLAIAFVAFRGPGLTNLITALLLIGWVGYARLVRGEVLKVREFDFVQGVLASGASDRRVLWRHIFPNIVDPLVVQVSLGMAGAVMSEASLSFLGLGITPPTPSWGSMLNAARNHIFEAPHLTLFPGLAIMLLVLAFNFLGEGLRQLGNRPWGEHR